jgi:hypothetical protein
VHRQDAMPESMTSAASSGYVRPAPTKPSYETPEERALKQVYIIRQSSIASAVDHLKGMKGAPASADEVLFLAKRFENHVMGNSIHDLENDIPN